VNEIIKTVRALRSELHNLAERSGYENRTKARLMDFLRQHTSLRLYDEGQWFYAVHEEQEGEETIAFRADMDALPFGEGASHLCGHDGHSAVLAGLGLMLDNKKLGRNIALIFQHAEETGAGGKKCCGILEKHQIRRVYAFHNIPGWEQGAVLLRRGTFACASRGMILTLTGAPSHAAYPEHGRNPGFAAARLIAALPELTNQDRFQGLTMATLIGADIGSNAFGSAAGKALIRLTLRAWFDDDLNALISLLEEKARTEAFCDGLEADVSFCDIFPATVNDGETLGRLEKCCREFGLSCVEVQEPFRWSEDFGYYGACAKAVMAGIGAGIDWPQLHTEHYEFNDEIIPAALKLFSALAENG
jgi:amidohydrolase